VPNIFDETVTLQKERKDKEVVLLDSNRTKKRVDDKDSMSEVRTLLEYLYLDVKVRSPEEVSLILLTLLRFNN
jgi:hypothetical protein